MTLPEHREKVVRLISGGILTDENVYDDLYIDSIINDGRAYVLRQDYIKNKRWSPSATQVFYPEYEEYYQNTVRTTRFNIPTSFIQANSSSSGLVYFGSSTDEVFKVNNFWTIKSDNELSDFLNSERMSPATGKYIGVMFQGLTVKVVSKESMVKYPKMVAVFDTPSALPDYNVQKDQYPLSGDLSDVMYDIIEKGTLKTIYTTIPDMTSDSRKTPVK